MAFASGDMNFTIAANSGDLTRQADGSYLAVWASGAQIWGQAFNADGSHRNAQFEVRTLPNAIDPFADISTTLLANGDIIVTWIEAGSVKAQRLGSDRQPIGTVKDIGSIDVVNQHAPEVYALANGGYTVLYKGNRAHDGVVTCTMTTVVGETITREPDSAGDDEHHAFAILTDGTFLIFYNNGAAIQLEDWTHFSDIKYLNRIDPDAPFGQAASALAGGKFVLAWQDRVTVGGAAVIKAQVFDANCDPVGTAVSFTPPSGTVDAMNIKQLSNGGFALLLTMNNGTDKDVYVATCSATGTVLMPPSLVGSSAAGDQTDPEIVALANGSFVVSWMNGANGTLMTEVFGASPVANTPPSNIHLTTGGMLASVEENKAAGSVVATVTADDNGGAAGLRYALADSTFEIDAVTGQIKVKAGAVLDYERASSHTLSVTVTDKNGTGLSASQEVSIKVSDVLESQQGTSGKNVLKGGIGADKLNGKSGNDTLTGSDGADIFVFDTALGKGTTSKNQNKKVNFDTITDFKPGQDKIWLDNKIFTKLGKSGSEAAPAGLNKKFFKMTKAKDSNDYIVYKNGIVSYDADGSGTRYKPVEIIKIVNKVTLTAGDFLVI